MPNQIIDNRDIRLIDEINKQLDHTERAKIAVGYFYLSGLKAIREKLEAKEPDGSYRIKEIRLLIGNSNSQLSVEQIAQEYRTGDQINKELEKQRYHKDSDRTAVSRKREIIDQTVKDVKYAISELDQSEDSISIVNLLRRMIDENRLKVKVYTRGRLHAKAYILDFQNPQPNSKGIAIVGSSNLSLAGFTNNTELNVYVHDNGENHDALTNWFNRLWDEAEDLETALQAELKESWPIYPATPYDIYMKTLYTLLKDRIEGGDGEKFLWENEITEALANFQKEAVKNLIGIIRQYGGAFAADVVGVGKSYISAAVAKHFLISEGLKPLIVCPKPLQEMWETYNAKYSLNAQILPMSLLREGPDDDGDWNFLFSDEKYKDRKFILIDESHHFRHSSPQRYKILQDFIHSSEKKVLLVTATPRNKSAKDIQNQIKLFHPNDKTTLPISPPDLKEYFKTILSDSVPKEKRDSLLKSLLQHILYRRTRNHILRWWGYDSKTHKKVNPYDFSLYLEGKKRAYILVGGEHRFFPKRNIASVTYSIEETYSGLYKRIRKYLGKAKFDYSGKPIPGELTYARFALWHYVLKGKQKVVPYRDLHRAGINLRGLMRVMLFKRFESSVYAFRMTIGRLIKIHRAFLKSLDEGIIPAGEEAQEILSGSDLYSEQDFIDALRESVSDKNYEIEDFSIKRLKDHLKHDLDILERIYEIVDENAIPPKKDAKLQKFMEILKTTPLNKGKVLIFSESAETVDYLFEQINPKGKPEIQKASSGRENKSRLVRLFSPVANKYELKKSEIEVRMVITTDVLSEGLNLQDCDKLINYDLHWNPVKLIQRFGRIDRIGSEHDQIYGFNFLPETELDENLNLHEIVHNRIQEIHDTIGEDAEILDNTEELNSEAMYAIYEGDNAHLSGYEDDQGYLDINEAEEILRQLRDNDPIEYERITNLRDGIRAAKSKAGDHIFVFCQAGKGHNRYSQFYLLNKRGNVISRDIGEILGKIKADKETLGFPLPKNYNDKIEKLQRIFNEEVYSRISEQKHSSSLTQAQQYILRELRLAFENTDNEDLRSEINLYDKAFRQVDRIAVKTELNKIRKHGLAGKQLIRKLQEIFNRHNLRELVETTRQPDPIIPKVICSEFL